MARYLPVAALGAADVAALVALRPSSALPGRIAAPHRWVAEVGPDIAIGALAGAALWLAAAWLGLGLLAVLAAELPGTLGRASRRLSAAVLPRAVQRLAAGAAGMGVLLSPALASAASTGGTAGAPAPPAATATATPAWPTDDALPTPSWPTSGPDRTPAHGTAGPARAPAPGPASTPTSPPTTAADVTVRPGDSLWRIAAAHLPPRASARLVAREWPRWYAANRASVGADPDRLAVGTVLHPPDRAPDQLPNHPPSTERHA